MKSQGMDYDATKHLVEQFRAEQDALIASFSQAMSRVATNATVSPRRVSATLGVALATLAASLSSAMVAVGAGDKADFKQNAEGYRKRLGTRVKRLIG